MSKEEVKKKIFLDELPKEKYGDYFRIDWNSSIGYKVYFIYDNIDNYFEIINYIPKGQKVTIKYNNNEYIIQTPNLLQCRIGKILGKVTDEFKIEIGTRLQDDKRNITIIDKEYREKEKVDKLGRKSILKEKWYNYHCNICSHKQWIVESALIGKQQTGCSCCAGRTVIQGINDIPTTVPWLIPYFQGNYEEAKLYTKTGSGNPNNPKGYIYPICPDCGRIKSKKKRIADIYRNHSIGCSCSDKIPYPEKFLFNILEQFKLDFKTQLTKTTFKWCQEYKYDFYFELNNEQYIIETHGQQHYEEQKRGRSLQQEQLNDKLKKQLALKNGIKPENYIVIDCRYSTLDWIKEHILKNTTLNNLFNLNKLDWNKCNEYACSNLVKKACEIKNNNPELTTTNIGNILNLSSSTICKYLKQGNGIWVNYNPKEEMIRVSIKASKEHSKKVEMFKDGISLGIFNSAKYLEDISEQVFKIKLLSHGISQVCRGDRRQYKGHTFKYI
jgi:hypothetical protein